MVETHIDNEIGNQLLQLYGLFCFNGIIPRQNNTYHGLWYASCGALRKGSSREFNLTTQVPQARAQLIELKHTLPLSLNNTTYT